MDASNASMYSTFPIFSKISKGPQYLAANFGKLPNFNELLLDLNFKNKCSPTLNSLCVLLLSTQFFYQSCATFKLCLIFTIYSSISLNNFGRITTIFCHTMLQMVSYSMILDTHYCRQTQLNGFSPLTYKGFPLHKFLAYLQLSD
jgi:hypothetical protein